MSKWGRPPSTDAYCFRDVDCYAYSDRDRDCHTYSDTDCYSCRDPDGYRDCHSYTHINGNSYNYSPTDTNAKIPANAQAASHATPTAMIPQ